MKVKQEQRPINLQSANSTMKLQDIKHSSSSTRMAANLCVAVVLFVTGCIDPYPPPLSKGEVNFLVVDGFLNSGNGVARVKLSRALPLESSARYPTEQKAVVQVEGDNGVIFSLPEVSAGTYQAVRSDLTIGSRYRLLIRTADLKTFESDFVTLKQSPELGDVTWVVEGDGITILVDARDASGSTRYYQWLYTETWEYDADKYSGYYIRNGSAIQRQPHEQIYVCYSSGESSKVLISTTRDQSGDVINDFPLVHIPVGSKKISRNYSINVQQRALDESSYSYWLQLQQTTEELGGLFDPLPGRVTGNIRATNGSKEVVLGYFNGGGVQEKRIYINHYALPRELRVVRRKFCPVDSIPNAQLRTLANGTAVIEPYGPPPGIEGYTITGATCLDCRSEGGTVTKPSFWPF